jgi:hypothetical protein
MKEYLPAVQWMRDNGVPQISDNCIESKHCLLINEAGRLFADETGDEIINQYLAKQERRRGFILFKYVNVHQSVMTI